NSYTGTSDRLAGGLVGWNPGWINNSYSYGSVTSGINSINVFTGGLVGSNNAGSITNSYSSGLVSGGGRLGGFVGAAQAGNISTSFWDINSSGQTAGFSDGFSSYISGGLYGGCFGNTTCNASTITNATNAVSFGGSGLPVNLALLT